MFVARLALAQVRVKQRSFFLIFFQLMSATIARPMFRISGAITQVRSGITPEPL